jgi:hypothetical protein
LVEEPAGDPVLTMQAADHPRSIAEAATKRQTMLKLTVLDRSLQLPAE